jgi:hypothetical protein
VPADAAPSSSAASSLFAAPSPSGSVAPGAAAPIASPALPPEAQAPTVPRQLAPAATKAVSRDDNGRRLVAFLILLAGLAFAGLTYLTPGAVAEDAGQGGLGRFRQPRTGPPPALS